MASCVLSVEHLDATISGTSTTGTVDITLGQTSANCILVPTFKSPDNGAATLNVRLPEVYFSDTDTITVQRNTGTDIGTITVHIEVIEFDPAQVEVTQGTFSMSSATSTTATIALNGAITDAFCHHNYRTSYTGTAPGRKLTRVTVTDTTTLTFNCNASTNSVNGRWFVAEALAGEFAVVHDQITLGSSAETANEAVTGDPALGKSFLIASQENGATNDDWVTIGLSAILFDNIGATTIQVSRGNGGNAGAFTATIQYQVVTLAQDETVQRTGGSVTGTTTDVSITAVDTDSATINSGIGRGMGQGNSSTGSDICGWHAHMTFADTDTVTISVVTDITPDGLYHFEVIDWAISGGGTPVSQTLSLQMEALGGIGSTLAMQMEALSGLDLTKSLQMEALGTIAATQSLQVEGLQGIDNSPPMQMEALGGLEAAPSMQMESHADIATTLSMQIESLLGVDMTLAMQMEALQGVAYEAFLQMENFPDVVAPLAPARNWQSPRGLGIITVDHCAPHVRMWNPDIVYTWTGEDLTQIIETAEDGTIAVQDLIWVDGQLTQIDRWLEL